jgi:hypothetical protein
MDENLPHPGINELAVEDQRTLMQAWGFVKQKQNGNTGKSGLPRDGAVRAVVSLSRIAMLRAHWDGPPDEPLRYMDLRCGGPAWSKRHFDRVFEALERASVEIRGILQEEREEFITSGVKTRVSGAHQKKVKERKSAQEAEAEQV